jgi:tetratricopeptide (TPR) repeat protein
MQPRILLFTYFLWYVSLASAQDIAPRDQNEINSRAISLVKEFEQLLNAISLKSTTASEIQELVQICHSDPNNRIFLNEKSVLEDDITPGAGDSTFVKDVSIQKYLNDLDLFYSKEHDETIKFSDFRLSPIRSKAYTFVKVYFESKFNGKHKEIDVPYSTNRRVAEVRADKLKDGKWDLHIVSITFFKHPASATEAEIMALVEKEFKPFVPLKTISLGKAKEQNDSSATLNFELQRRADSLYAAAIKEQTGKLEEQQRKDALFNKTMRRADSLFAVRSLPEALEAYTEARAIKPYETQPRNRIREITKMIASGVKDDAQLFAGYVEEGDRLFKTRDYEGARSSYKQALEIQPDNAGVKSKLEITDGIIRNKTELKSLYMAGDFKAALKGYNKLISDNKNNPLYYFERAQCYLRMKDFKKAQIDLSKAIELDPTYTEAIQSRASVYLRNNEVPKAISDYTTILTTNKNDPQTLSKRGNAYVLVNDFAAAEKDFLAALNYDADNVVLMKNLANTYFQRQQYVEAKNWLNKAIEKNPGYSDAWFLKGFVNFESGNYEEGSKDILKCRSLGMTLGQKHQLEMSAEGFMQKAAKALETKNHVEALKHAEIATQIITDSDKAWMLKGDAWMLAGNYDEARNAFQKAITFNPNSAIASEKLAFASFKAGRFEDAIPYFKKSIKQEPDYRQPYYNLGLAYFELQQYDSTIFILTKLIELDKNYKDAYNLRARAHTRRENYSRAIVDIEAVISMDKKNAAAYYERALVNRYLKQPDKSIADFEKAEALGYNPYDIKFGMASAYKEMGEYKKAVKNYTDAIRINPNVALAFLERGMAHFQLKMEREAMNDLAEALKMDSTLAKPAIESDLAFLKLKFADYEGAERLFTKITVADKFNAKAVYGLACANFHNGKKELSFKNLEDALMTKKIRWEDIKSDPWLKEISKTKEFKKLKKTYL